MINVVLFHSLLSLLDNMVHFIFLLHLGEEVLAPLFLKHIFTDDGEQFCAGLPRFLIFICHLALQELAGIAVFDVFQVFSIASFVFLFFCFLQIIVVLQCCCMLTKSFIVYLMRLLS